MNAIRADIVPGVTTVDELGDLFRTGYRKDGSGLRHGDTIEAGDLICFQAGLQSFNEDPYWPCTSLCYCGYCLLPARCLVLAGWLLAAAAAAAAQAFVAHSWLIHFWLCRASCFCAFVRPQSATYVT